MNTHFVFVYGTLRQGGFRAMPGIFPDSKFVGTANVHGRLYDFGEFPGLRIDESSSTVTGEVYQIDEEVLNRLDEIEVSSNYLRKQIVVSVGDRTVTCWIYEPDPEFYSLSNQITSGDWIEYARTKPEPDEEA
jgi:gamma-glutamylcyclotransferase (GGCT)/AIG2-like uncharacterized protein YtfP